MKLEGGSRGQIGYADSGLGENVTIEYEIEASKDGTDGKIKLNLASKAVRSPRDGWKV